MSAQRGNVTEFSKINLVQYGFHFIYFLLFRTTPVAYGGSQARGLIRDLAAGLHQSHSNAGYVGSEPRLRPTPQLTATPDP